MRLGTFYQALVGRREAPFRINRTSEQLVFEKGFFSFFQQTQCLHFSACTVAEQTNTILAVETTLEIVVLVVQ